MSAVYIEFTEYYYPDGKDFPSKSIPCLVFVCSLLMKFYFFLAKFLSFINVKKEKQKSVVLYRYDHCVLYITLVEHFYILICFCALFPY